MAATEVQITALETAFKNMDYGPAPEDKKSLEVSLFSILARL